MSKGGAVRAPGVTRAAGDVAAGGTIALALLVCGCVFTALAGPAVSLRLRTQALHQAIGPAGSLGASVEVQADAHAFTTAYYASTQNLSESDFSVVTSTIADGIAATLPVAAGGWGGITSRLHLVTSGVQDVPSGEVPELEATFRAPLTSNVQVVAGRLTGTPLPAGAVGVAVTQQTAKQFGLRTGSLVRIGTQDGQVTLAVTAIVRARDPGSSFWTADPLPASPQVDMQRTATYLAGAALVDPGQLAAMQNAFCRVADTYCEDFQLQWEYPLVVSQLTANQAQTLLNELSPAALGTGISNALGNAYITLSTSSPMSGVLTAFLATQTAILAVLLLLFASLIVVGAAVIVLAARMIVARRRDELIMLRARGASSRQVAALLLRAAALPAVPAAGAGLLLAAVAAPGAFTDSAALGWQLTAGLLAVALGGPPLIAAWQHRNPAPSVNPARIVTAATAPGRFALRRLTAEVTACAAAVGGLIVLHSQGQPPPGDINWYLTVAPILVAVPAVLIALRLYPLVIQGLVRMTRRRAGATGYVALASSARTSLATTGPAFTLVLALTLAAFAGMIGNAITRGQDAAAWQSAGADAVISTDGAVDPITPADVKAITAVPGVRLATPAWNTVWETGSGQQIDATAVSPAGYSALTAGTPFPGIAPAAIAVSRHGTQGGGTIGVLASPSAAAALGHRGAELTSGELMGPITVRVDGVVASTPARPGGGTFILLPLEPLPGPLGSPAPDMLLVSGPDIDQARLTAVADRDLPTASIAFRSDVLAGLRDAPLPRAAALMLTIGILAAAGLGLLNLTLGLALGAPERQLTLARLDVLGHQRHIMLVLVEALPAVLTAIAAAAACALTLPALVGPALDLSVFTGSGVPVQIRPDLTPLGLTAGIVVLMAGTALAAEIRRSRRHGITYRAF